jgi:hypothetical protein
VTGNRSAVVLVTLLAGHHKALIAVNFLRKCLE